MSDTLHELGARSAVGARTLGSRRTASPTPALDQSLVSGLRAVAAAHLSWAASSWTDRRESPATREGFSLGFPGLVEGEERVRTADGDSLDRVAARLQRRDPENLLRSDPNVAPRADATATSTRADAFKS